MKGKGIIALVGSAIVGAISGIIVFQLLSNNFVAYDPSLASSISEISHNEPSFQHVSYTPYASNTDFTNAAAISTPAVVHIKTSFVTENHTSPQQFYGNDLYQWFFGSPYQPNRKRESQASGSGVIISKDGYIVTNNHVIDRAHTIEVTLSNNQTYPATLVGIDKDTDIALIKIDENDLPMLPFADSDNVLVGQWVMAVGNPFNLSSTVTAGIVSAKGRDINILENINGQSNTAIEAFIQTDAAVNPGNSGGALVNLDGQLIGINTAIATPTGSFTGYSFAVPSNLVAKVVEDLKEYGIVQRGFLGVNIRDMDGLLAEELNLDNVNGVYLQDVIEHSAAADAGLKKGDVIVSIDDVSISSSPELQQKIAEHSPGDYITVCYVRNGNQYSTKLQLKNKYNDTETLSYHDQVLEQLGVELSSLSAKEQHEFRVEGGVQIEKVGDGKIKTYTDIKDGFIVTMINDKRIYTVDDFIQSMSSIQGNVLIEGIYPNRNYTYLYALKM